MKTFFSNKRLACKLRDNSDQMTKAIKRNQQYNFKEIEMKVKVLKALVIINHNIISTSFARIIVFIYEFCTYMSINTIVTFGDDENSREIHEKEFIYIR